MEAGAEDFEFGDGVIEISATSDPNEFRAVREALEAKGYSFVEADIQKVPSTYTKIDDPELCEKTLSCAKRCRNSWTCWTTTTTFRKSTTTGRCRKNNSGRQNSPLQTDGAGLFF